jgi:hypothetical protein
MGERVSPIPGLPPTASQLVKPHILKTTGYVVAQSGDCLKIMRREAALDPKRQFVAVEAHRLGKLAIKGSWFMGVLLCPGDSTDLVAAWARVRPAADLGRIRVYFHTGTNLHHAMAAWVRATLPDPLFEEDISTWEQFHKVYGGHHAIQVYSDFVANSPTGIP